MRGFGVACRTVVSFLHTSLGKQKSGKGKMGTIFPSCVNHALRLPLFCLCSPKIMVRRLDLGVKLPK